MNETEMTVVGNLITKVDKRRLADGTTVVSFRVASNERRFDRVSSTWRDGDTLYLSVTAWRELAEHVHSSMMIGDPIIVCGRLFTNSYDKDGRHHSVTELEATAVGPNLRWSTAVVARSRRNDGLPAGALSDVPASLGDARDDGPSDDPWATAVESIDTFEEDGFDEAEVGGVGADQRVAAEAGVRG